MAKTYKKILVPLDGSRLAEQALEDVKAVVSENKTCLIILIRVVEPLLPIYVKDSISAEHYKAAEEKLESEAKDYLMELAEELMRGGMRVEVELIVGGMADEVILDYAKEKKVDLIVMSTHGRSGVARWIFGSVAQRVIRHSSVPVLLVPSASLRHG